MQQVLYRSFTAAVIWEAATVRMARHSSGRRNRRHLFRFPEMQYGVARPNHWNRAMPVIESKDLVKHYKKVQALKGVSLKVEKGEIFGLLGRNGAGKTTFVKILLGMVHRTSGDANLMGRPVG